jgi:rubrerythrin
MAITSRDPEIRKKYNRMRNQVKSHVNKLKNKYEKDLVQRAKENPKVIWKYFKSKSKTRDGISDLHMNPADTKSPKTDIDEEKAKILSKYFLSVFTTETNGNVPNLELNQSINPIFKFRNN